MTEKSAEKPHILIVEDDFDLLDMMEAYFRVQGYEVLTASWGRDGLKLSAEKPVDLILLDIRLPDIDGYEVCRELRTQRRTQDTPIIFLTEKRDRVNKLQGLELGVVDYITKPFDIQELRLRVRNALTRAAQMTVVNPVTELPEVAMLDERLNQALYGDTAWALLLLSIGGLNTLRELYGFVATDEALRAIALMVKSAVTHFGGEDDFIGHLSAEEFVILTTTASVESIRDRIETRLRQSLRYFYRPRELEAGEADFLTLQTAVVDHAAEQFQDAEQVKQALSAAIASPAPKG